MIGGLFHHRRTAQLEGSTLPSTVGNGETENAKTGEAVRLVTLRRY